MKTSIIALVAVALTLPGMDAIAQRSPLRGFGLLASNSDDSHSGLGNPGRSSLVEMPDGGGGGSGARSMHGDDFGDASRPRHAAAVAGLPDALPPKAMMPSDDPAQPAAAPKRSSYRWQSLVPGAIK